jgi:hypothetical protein
MILNKRFYLNSSEAIKEFSMDAGSVRISQASDFAEVGKMLDKRDREEVFICRI